MLKALLDILLPPLCPVCECRLKEGPMCVECRCLLLESRIKGPACRTCGAPFTGSYDAERECGGCLTQKTPFVKARSLLRLSEPVHSAIRSFKYSGRVELASALGRLLSEAPLFDERMDFAVPVPLHKDRLRQRGFNQSLLLAREVSKAASIKIDYNNLNRMRVTEPQARLDAKERVKNVRGAFMVKDTTLFRGKNILLIDDVITTGSTIKECAKALSAAGARVYVLTLARNVTA
ncbi:MAG: ComF family protein [Deltaproteobacteria bacterium]